MSEFDKEYTSGSSEKSEAVEAFEDFEMSLDDVGSADEIPEVFDVTDVADAAGGGVRHMEPVRGFGESGQLHAVSAVLYTPGVHGGQDRLCTHPITWLYLMPHQSPSNTVT